MKKFLFLFISCIASLSASAEDVIAVAPGNIAGGGKAAPCNVFLSTSEYTNYVTQIQYEVYPSAGLSITNCSLYTGEGTSVPYTEEEDWDNFDDDGNPLMKKTFLAVYTGKNQGDYYGVVLMNPTKNTYTSSNGQIAKVIVKADAGLADGYYPVYIKNVSISGADAVSHQLPNTVFYVKVGNPTDASLALSDEIPAVVNTALATAPGLTTLDLTKVTASNGTFTYVDGRKVIAPEATVASKVAYKRAVSGLASICLPFDATVDAYIYNTNDGKNALFDAVSQVPAGTSAIVEKDIDITADATIGGCAKKTIDSGYYLKGGKFCQVNGSATIPALRGCWDKDIPVGVKGFILGDATAISTIDADADADIYNMSGVKLNKANRGVNIIGNKKVLVK